MHGAEPCCSQPRGQDDTAGRTLLAAGGARTAFTHLRFAAHKVPGAAPRGAACAQVAARASSAHRRLCGRAQDAAGPVAPTAPRPLRSRPALRGAAPRSEEGRGRRWAPSHWPPGALLCMSPPPWPPHWPGAVGALHGSAPRARWPALRCSVGPAARRSAGAGPAAGLGRRQQEQGAGSTAASLPSGGAKRSGRRVTPRPPAALSPRVPLIHSPPGSRGCSMKCGDGPER